MVPQPLPIEDVLRRTGTDMGAVIWGDHFYEGTQQPDLRNILSVREDDFINTSTSDPADVCVALLHVDKC